MVRGVGSVASAAAPEESTERAPKQSSHAATHEFHEALALPRVSTKVLRLVLLQIQPGLPCDRVDPRALASFQDPGYFRLLFCPHVKHFITN